MSGTQLTPASASFGAGLAGLGPAELAGLVRHVAHGGEAESSQAMPFDRLLAAEAGELEEAGYSSTDAADREAAYVFKRGGARAVVFWLAEQGQNPQGKLELTRLLKAVFTLGRAMGLPQFTTLTMQEEALMFGESKAAVSWRLKQVSGMVQATGARGFKLPGQKRETTAYREAQKGNRNRRGKKKRPSQPAAPGGAKAPKV